MVKLSSVRKSNLKRKLARKGRGPARSKATNVLAQGAGAITRRAFGARRVRPGTSFRTKMLQGLNARLPLHLGLPRPVGPYQVIRTTKLHSTTSAVVIFAPIMHNNFNLHDQPTWYHACGLEETLVGPINNPAGTTMIDMPMGALGSAAEMVPAALTVQVMNKAPINEASGLFTMGRVSQQLQLGGEARTWATFKNEFDSYFKPRLLTGGKLALRGVTCNAVPLDMTDFSTFASGEPAVPAAFQWETDVMPAALSPIVFTQTGTPVEISFLVTIEWRVRFDPFHPASASHSFHPSTPDSVWNGIISAASAAGHGVVDIADEVADVGFDVAAIAGTAAAMGGA